MSIEREKSLDKPHIIDHFWIEYHHFGFDIFKRITSWIIFIIDIFIIIIMTICITRKSPIINENNLFNILYLSVG